MIAGATNTMQQGTVIGEISYRLNRPATATVVSSEPCLTLRWAQDELRALCEKVDNIKQAVDQVLSSHMAQKLSGGPNQEEAAQSPA